MKKKSKGFMLFETLVVSTVILGTLVFLLVQFSAIKRNYDIAFKYNTIPNLYYVKNISDILTTDGYQSLVNALDNSENGYIDISKTSYYLHPEYGLNTFYIKLIDKMGVKCILFTNNDILVLQNYIKTLNGEYSNNFKQFILSRSQINEASYYRLIVEFQDDTFAEINIGRNKTINEE